MLLNAITNENIMSFKKLLLGMLFFEQFASFFPNGKYSSIKIGFNAYFNYLVIFPI